MPVRSTVNGDEHFCGWISLSFKVYKPTSSHTAQQSVLVRSVANGSTLKHCLEDFTVAVPRQM